MAACDFKISVTDHAEFPFHDRGGIRADEQEEIAANVYLCFHSPRGVNADIRDSAHECAQEIDLGALPNPRCPVLGQDDSDGDIANEPALTPASKHEHSDEHSEDHQDKRPRNGMN